MLKKILKRIFSIEDCVGSPYARIYILGFKIRFNPEQNWFNDIISRQIAREVCTALDVQALHSKTFPKFKNINKDKCVTIVGCGPTLKYYNNEANFENIALNKAILLENINYKYSFCVDDNILKTCPGYLDIIHSKKECIKFLGKSMHPERGQLPELVHDENDNYYRFYSGTRHCMPARDFGDIIYPNIETHALVDFWSISFAALHFAFYTHPKKIYLVGLDTSSGAQYFTDKQSYYNHKRMLLGYKKFKKFAELHYPDVEIISINPVGLKGLFKDVYTQSYVNEHPEILKENIEIIK